MFSHRACGAGDDVVRRGGSSIIWYRFTQSKFCSRCSGCTSCLWCWWWCCQEGRIPTKVEVEGSQRELLVRYLKSAWCQNLGGWNRWISMRKYPFIPWDCDNEHVQGGQFSFFLSCRTLIILVWQVLCELCLEQMKFWRILNVGYIRVSGMNELWKCKSIC